MAMTAIERNTSQIELLPISAVIHDDAKLVQRVLMGDALAENTIYRRYAPLLLNMAARLLRRLSDTDDVVQETFVVAFRKLTTLKEPAALKPWLVRILISQVHRALRVRRCKAFFGLDSSDDDDASLERLAVHNARPDLRAELHELDIVLHNFSPERRTAWLLHRVEGMSISETSKAMGRSLASIKRYISAVDTAVHMKRGLE